jgi:hypothetical protein
MLRFFLVAGLVLGLMRPAWADFQAGQAAFDRGDYETALEHWLPLAESGSAAAQWRLASMYYRGQGTPQDHAEAAKWLQLAAGQGLAVAQYNLGGLYEIGDAVTRDLVRAYMWYSLAAAGYPPGSQQERAARSRDRVALKLSPQRLDEAQALARRWHGDAAVRAGAVKLQPSRKTVAGVQQSLIDLGYDPGPVDGIVGPKTRAAIRAFQADRGLKATGEVSVDLVRELRVVLAARGRGVRAGASADDVPDGGLGDTAGAVWPIRGQSLSGLAP